MDESDPAPVADGQPSQADLLEGESLSCRRIRKKETAKRLTTDNDHSRFGVAPDTGAQPNAKRKRKGMNIPD